MANNLTELTAAITNATNAIQGFVTAYHEVENRAAAATLWEHPDVRELDTTHAYWYPEV